MLMSRLKPRPTKLSAFFNKPLAMRNSFLSAWSLRSRGERIRHQPLNFLFKFGARPRSIELRVGLSIGFVENRGRNRSIPRGINRMIETVDVDSRLLAVIREIRMIHGKEMADDVQIGIRIEAHANKNHSLGLVLLRQTHEHGIFRAARLAPRGPEIHDQRLASIFRQ